mmetsp:Transcript_21840/g.41660  ORF Transcript_21840/g.41660 Transcript_21840/m.41660 type:complete len:143 (+) Transcript_21840:60-488(+)|eukprot:CAMPEP_0114265620 /NCGR_PEP_ID=MMETSP0058-20121206/24040_1 /TAXON_ID=36894 /ORGANISM="Pyramimonas parkeae, CCMP726" /LENGTH=142 /DNA_ID=CAMNT_0001382779 /DNA_START=41 /DNA_END=469 /DNA_ORIENTATION=+
MGKAPKHKNKGTHTRKGYKVAKRAKFLSRGMDQVWEDVRSEEPVHDAKSGPRGSTAKVEHDEDLAGFGQHYCIACSRYFQSVNAMMTHEKTKIHKKRIRELKGDRPHNQEDAEAAAGMGKPDNGPKLRGDIADGSEGMMMAF